MLFSVGFLFVHNFVRIENGTPWLRVLSPGDLPKIDSKGCFKTIQILEGLVLH